MSVIGKTFILELIAVFILVDHSRDVACNVPTRLLGKEFGAID